MTNREIFHTEIYNLLKNSIENIDNDLADDIYALLFWTTDIDPYPIICVRQLTMKNYKNNLENPNKEIVAWYSQHDKSIDDQIIKWDFDFCSEDNNIVSMHLEDFKPFVEWLNESTAHSSPEAFHSLEEVDSELYWEIYSDISNHFNNYFIEEIISVIKQLFDDDVVKSKFHKNIPIIIDQYTRNYEETIDWTTRSNSINVANEFIEWAAKNNEF